MGFRASIDSGPRQTFLKHGSLEILGPGGKVTLACISLVCPKGLLDSVGEGEGGMIWENGIETCIISYKKRITSPGLIQVAWGWCTGMTRRNGMGREVGGVFRMGNMHTPMADSC